MKFSNVMSSAGEWLRGEGPHHQIVISSRVRLAPDWQPLVEQNLRFVGIELAAAPSADLPSWRDFAAHSE